MAIDVNQLIPEHVLKTIREKMTGLTAERFQLCLEETLRFLALSLHGGKTFLHGNKEIDDLWHELILETHTYQALNAALKPGGFVHHSSITYRDYAAKMTAADLHAEELSFLASYVHNFGEFEEDRVQFWTTCGDVKRRMGWTTTELNLFCVELVLSSQRFDDEFDSEVHKKMSEIVCGGGEMSPDDLLLYMNDYGGRNPFACTFFALMIDASGRNYYARVSAVIQADNQLMQRRILDIACGEGIGLSYLPNTTELHGIDVSESDLRIAEKKLSDRNAQFYVGSAQNLPFDSESFDFVICNMALMLMNPLDKVLKEAFRVLRPGAKFVSVIPSALPSQKEITQKFSELNIQLAKAHIPQFPYLGFGPGYLKNNSAITEKFKQDFDPRCEIVLSNEVFSAWVTPDEAADFTSAMYWADLLPRSKRKMVRQKFYDFFECHRNEDGLVEVERTFAIISVTKSLMENSGLTHDI